MEVTDTSNDNYDIAATISAKKHAARGRAGARSKSQDKAGVRKVGLVSLPLLLLASNIFFHALKKLRPKDNTCRNEESRFRRLQRRE